MSNDEKEKRPEERFVDRFIEFDYAEMKDLSKAFLTLASAVLAFSVTFSEKSVNFQSANYVPKLILIASWACFILSVILCGLSLCLQFFAATKAIHGEWYIPYLKKRVWFGVATFAGVLLFFAGTAFTIGLLALLISAAIPVLS